MAHEGKEHREAAEHVLREAGFSISQACVSRPSCFDFAARRDRKLVFLKIQRDIGNTAMHDCEELKAIAAQFSASCLLIGEEAREKPLEDDTVHRRHDILAVNSRTFENFVLHSVRPLIQASPGGYYVDVDSEALKKRRQEMELSVGDLANMVGISRRTIYGYERGLAKASVPAAYNLVRALGIPVARSVDIFQRPTRQYGYCLLNRARRVFSRNKLLGRILRKLAPLHIVTVKKAPFDFVLNVPEEKMRIIGGVAAAKELQLDQRIDEILSVSRVTRARPIFITEGSAPMEKNIQCINREEFSKIRDPEDLIATVR